jgi:CRP-like cAMP-binding protein
MSFFETLPVDLQNSLRAVGSTQEFETGAAIIRSGSVDNTLYVLLSGSLKVEFSEQVIQLAVGDVVGEMAFLDNRPRTATVRADTNCSLLVLEREPTFQALSAQPLLLNALIEALMDQQHTRLTKKVIEDKRTPIEYVEGLAAQALGHRAASQPGIFAPR